MTHAIVDRINRKGMEGVWKCRRCARTGTYAELRKVQCTDPRPASDEELLDVIVGVPPAHGGTQESE